VSLGSAVRASVVADAAAALTPDLVVLSIGAARPSAPDRDTLRALAGAFPLSLGGVAATQRLVAALGARPLPRDVVSAAAQFVAGYAGTGLTAARTG
jgi:hypothetical protein